jgi:hypothetical protein
MTQLLANCETLKNLNKIIDNVNLEDKIVDLLENIHKVSQTVYGPKTDQPVECRILASIYNCVLLNKFTVINTNKIPDLGNNQVMTVFLYPPINSNEYHYLTIYSIDENTYRVYSANGNSFVPPFNISKELFNDYYQKIVNRNPADMVYPENGMINDTPIAKYWNAITGDDLGNVFERELNERRKSNEDNDDYEDNPEEDWEDYMHTFQNLSYPAKYVWIYTKQSGGKRKPKRQTKKRRTHKKKTLKLSRHLHSKA